MSLVEIIATSVEDAIAAERRGATRIELCSDLANDGVAPTLELAERVVRAVNIPVRVMVRERNAVELADEAELERQCAATRAFASAGVSGVVYGNVRAGEIDTRALERVLASATALPFTFHRAIESARDMLAAVQTLKRYPQVDTVLTNGGAGGWDERISRLSAMASVGSPGIEILVGGGLTLDIVRRLRAETNLRAFHFGRAARFDHAIERGVDADAVRAIVGACV